MVSVGTASARAVPTPSTRHSQLTNSTPRWPSRTLSRSDVSAPWRPPCPHPRCDHYPRAEVRAIATLVGARRGTCNEMRVKGPSPDVRNTSFVSAYRYPRERGHRERLRGLTMDIEPVDRNNERKSHGRCARVISSMVDEYHVEWVSREQGSVPPDSIFTRSSLSPLVRVPVEMGS